MILKEISRGITHIEDLPPREIIEILTNLSDFQITEKVDGAQILFGMDEIGFYTSRETKGGERMYSESSYSVNFPTTYMRSVHRLLEGVLPELRAAGLRPGDQVEAEVLYGELPNVVPYSADTNYLIFLRTTEGTVNIDRLKQKLDGRVVSVSLNAPHTSDGRTITLEEETNNWEFARVPIVEHGVQNAKCIQLKRFLSTKDHFVCQTYGTLLETPLNKIPDWVEPGSWKEIKEYIKERRALIQAKLLEEHILPLKENLLNNIVRNRGSAFGPTLEEGGWIEGVVLKNAAGKVVKLVDKDTFGAVREDAWEYRNTLTESAKSVDGHHSFLASMYVAMATALSHPELGTIQAKSFLRKSGTITEEIVANLSHGIKVNSVKEYWLGLFEQYEKQLTSKLDKYSREAKSNTLFEGAINKRTLETFATVFQKIEDLRESTRNSTSNVDLFVTLVGKQLSDIDMRLDEIVTLGDVLKADQYMKVLNMISTKIDHHINATRIKNQVINSWKKGMKSRKHYNSLLNQIDISLNDVLD